MANENNIAPLKISQEISVSTAPLAHLLHSLNKSGTLKAEEIESLLGLAPRSSYAYTAPTPDDEATDLRVSQAVTLMTRAANGTARRTLANGVLFGTCFMAIPRPASSIHLGVQPVPLALDSALPAAMAVANQILNLRSKSLNTTTTPQSLRATIQEAVGQLLALDQSLARHEARAA